MVLFPGSTSQRLILVLILNLAMIGGLVIVGLSSHSLGVLAAGGDYLADAAAIGISIMAIYIGKHPNGYAKATTYAALINVVFLLVVTVFVVIEAIRRLSSQAPQIEAFSVICVSTVAAVVMIVSAYVLGADIDEEDLNMKSVILDTVADTAAAIGVAISGGIIFALKGFYWLDPAVALAVALVIGYHTLKLLREIIVKLKLS